MKIERLQLISQNPYRNSKWNAVVMDNYRNLQNVILIRMDTETEDSLIEKIKKCKTIQDVKKLSIKMFYN